MLISHMSMIRNWFFLLLLTVTSSLFAQLLSKSSIYIEESPKLEKELHQALMEQLEGALQQAAQEYQTLMDKSSGKLFPFRNLDLEKIARLKKIVQLFRERKFAFQKERQQEESGSYRFIPEIFRKYPPTMISQEQLQQLAEVVTEQGYQSNWLQSISPAESGHYVGAGEVLRLLISHLPHKYLKELQSSPEQIEKTFRQSWEQQRPELIKQLLQENPLWKDYLKAVHFLGTYYFAQGEVDQALGYWQRLLRFLPDEEKNFQNQLIAQIATAAFVNDDHLLFEQIYQKNRHNNSQVSLKGKPVSLGKYLRRIPKEFGNQQPSYDWTNYRGNAGRNKSAPPMAEEFDYRLTARYFLSRSSDQKTFPLYWQDHLYYKLENQVVCLDIQEGKQVWRFPKNPSYSYYRRQNRPSYKSMVIANGCLYFFAHKDFLKERTVVAKKPADTVFAVDAKTGKLLWSWPHPADEKSFASNIQFHFAPIASENKLYASATVIKGETIAEVICFDISQDQQRKNRQDLHPKFADPGKVQWRRFVCSSLQQDLRESPHENIFAAGLTAQYGMLYYCTNMGIIAALDAQTGEIRWLNNYLEHATEKYQLRSNCKPPQGSWQNLPPIAKNGSLYITPTDSGKLHIYNCFTGALQRSFPEKRGNETLDRLLGVDKQGYIYLAGSSTRGATQVVVLQERGDQEIRWQTILPGSIQGQGILTDKFLYILADNTIYRLAKDTGKHQVVMRKSRESERDIGQMIFGAQSMFNVNTMVKKYLILTGRDEIVIYQNP